MGTDPEAEETTENEDGPGGQWKQRVGDHQEQTPNDHMRRQASFTAAKIGSAGPCLQGKVRSHEDQGVREGAAGRDKREEWASRREAGVLPPAPSRSAAGGDPSPEVVGKEEGCRAVSLQHLGITWDYLDRGLTGTSNIGILDFWLFLFFVNGVKI